MQFKSINLKFSPKYLLSIFVDVKNIKNDIYTFSEENCVWCLKTFCSLNMAQIPPSMYIDGIFFPLFYHLPGEVCFKKL